MKKLLIITCILTASMSVSMAKKHQVGFSAGGAEISKNKSKSNDLGLSFGFNYAYKLNENFSVTANFIEANGVANNIMDTAAGETVKSSETLNYKSLSTGIKASAPKVTKYLDLYVVAGVAYSKLNKEVKNKKTSEVTTTDKTGYKPYVGVGAEVIISDTIGLDINVKRLLLPDDHKSDKISLGVNVKF